MNFSVIQNVTDAWGGSSAHQTTITVKNSGDSLLIFLAAEKNAAPTLTSLTLDGTDITPDALIPFAGGVVSTSTYYGWGLYLVNGVSAGAHTLTSTVNTSNSCLLQVAEIPAGLGSVDVLSAVNTGSSSTNPTTASITPTSNNDVILTLLFLGSHEGVTAQSSGFTTIGDKQYVEETNWAYAQQSEAAPVAGNATIGGATAFAMQTVAIKTLVIPTVTEVNGGEDIPEGATNVAVVGANFASGMTAAITQPGGVSVPQTFAYTDASDGVLTLVMEPGTGDQLAFTDATYETAIEVTTGGNTSSPFSITLVPPSGLLFQTLASINPNSSQSIQANPALVAGDQLEAAGDASGVTAAPAGLVLNDDATWQFTSGNTPQNFYVRAYDSANKVWGPWALQTVNQTVTITVPANLLPALHQFFSLLPG